jgi:sn-glycerol 3-phosphate transport system substrate-binding protein
MVNRRPVTKLASLLLTLALLLTACGSKQQSGGEQPAPTETQKPTGGPVTIEFWYAVGGRSDEWIKAAVERFNSSQSEVQVKATYQGDYYTNHQKLSTALAANSAPAISMI